MNERDFRNMSENNEIKSQNSIMLQYFKSHDSKIQKFLQIDFKAVIENFVSLKISEYIIADYNA